MQALTPEQTQLLEKRQARFGAFLGERADVLVDFFERIGADQPHNVIANPDAYLAFLEKFLGAQDEKPDRQDKSYLRARLIYFVGGLFIQRYGGQWLVHENPESRQFARYVVGHFPGLNVNLTIDPATVVEDYLNDANRYGLTHHVQAAEHEMTQYDEPA